jgi:hypothetical protein
VDRDGTATLVHLGNSGVTRIRMNLHRPDTPTAEDGSVVNDHLREGRPDGGPTLTGELWRGFASFWRSGAEVG